MFWVNKSMKNLWSYINESCVIGVATCTQKHTFVQIESETPYTNKSSGFYKGIFQEE